MYLHPTHINIKYMGDSVYLAEENGTLVLFVNNGEEENGLLLAKNDIYLDEEVIANIKKQL